MAKPNLNTREDTRKWDCSVMAKPTLKSEYDPVPQEAGSRFHSFTSFCCIVQDSTDSAIARMPKYEVDIPCRSQMTRLASITSYWARLSKPNVRRSSYKDGVMGEMGHWTQPILFRFWWKSKVVILHKIIFFRWRASLWKTVWKPLIVYLLLYLAISLIYRSLICGSSFINGPNLLPSLAISIICWLLSNILSGVFQDFLFRHF